MSRTTALRRLAFALAAAAAAALASCAPRQREEPTLLIRSASLVDGTGAKPRVAAVRVHGGKVLAIGDLSPRAGEHVVDGSGLVLAPGFIDTHSHHDAELQGSERDAQAALSQGITTIVVGQDGGSHHPLADYFTALEREPPPVNVASYAGHGTLRRLVMGDDFRRPATSDELDRMAALLEQELAAGALGLGTGLEYDPGIYSSREEVLELARVAAAAGGRYISHVRSEDRFFWEAVDEIIEIGRQAGLPVQVSHLKLAMTSLHGQSARLLALLDQARTEGVEISADVYPYTYWLSTLTVLFPERDFTDVTAARQAVYEISTPEGILVPAFAPEPRYQNRTLRSIADERGEAPEVTLMRLIAMAQAYQPKENEGEDIESVMATSMTEDDVAALLAWPHANVCSDGSSRGAHPRGFGAFARVLARYVRERRALSLEDAIHRMTGLAAAHVGLRGRGTIVPGAAADLVLFDADAVIDHATPERPHEPSTGIDKVWVNGVLALDGGRTTGSRSGRVLRRIGRAS